MLLMGLSKFGDVTRHAPIVKSEACMEEALPLLCNRRLVSLQREWEQQGGNP